MANSLKQARTSMGSKADICSANRHVHALGIFPAELLKRKTVVPARPEGRGRKSSSFASAMRNAT